MAKTIIHLLRYLAGLDSAHTQTTDAERAALIRHAKGRKHLVEIGVYEGVTTAILARAMAPDGVLYAVDPFLPGRLGICWGKWVAKREVARAKPLGRVVFIEKFSHHAVPLIKGDLDFVFIDGDHSYEGIQCDWADWSPRISPTGTIALHDTRVPAHNPNVAELGSYRFFETIIRHDRRFEIVERVDSLSILVRRGAAADG